LAATVSPVPGSPFPAIVVFYVFNNMLPIALDSKARI